jgi:hypothetical protein
MNPKYYPIVDWDFARWFVTLSPLIGILLGLLLAILVNH